MLITLKKWNVLKRLNKGPSKDDLVFIGKKYEGLLFFNKSANMK
jgi:hypothetical protein